MRQAYEVRPLETEEYTQWDELVSESAQGTLFHTSNWLKGSGNGFRIYGCFKGHEIRGGLAIGIYGKRCAGHPDDLTPYLGIILPPPEGKYVTSLTIGKEISLALARHLKKDFNSIDCRFPPEIVDLQPFIWEGYATSVLYTYRVDISDLDSVWRNMEPTRRKNIRRAQNDGVVIEHEVQFSEVFSLVEKTFKRQGKEVTFKSSAFRYNEVLSKAKRCRAFLARDKAGEGLAAVYIVWDEKRAYYLLGGYNSETSHHGAGALAMWDAIRFTRETLGLREFDFEGSTIPSVERFFRKFGAILAPTYRVTWRNHTSQQPFLRRVKRKAVRFLGL